MPQLERLVLHSATPFAGPYPIEVKRTSTLPSLTHLDISAPAGDCALALAHLDLPALTWLCVTAKSRLPHGGDIHKVLRHVAQHAHGPQDIQPLQSVLIHGDRKRLDILAWPLADNDIEAHDKTSFLAAKSSARVALSVTSRSWYTNTTTSVLDSVVTTLPLDNLVTLTAQHHTRFNDEFWKNYAPQWPLLQRVRLAAPAARWFREALLGNSGRECPLLPSLKRLDLIDDTALSVYKTLRLCDTLMRRVEQGVPVEVLDLSTCLATSRAVQLLSEIVVDVLGPAETLDTKGQKFCTWISASTARGYFVRDEHSGDDEYSDDSYDDDNSHIRDDDLDWFESDIDDEVVEAEEEGGGEGERDEYSEIEED
ncbi:hypothetical protein EI94DRAFT_1704793 [Lactarius quietus]|nr:hypothetical protein EI94DRAFT_1704793 [Lactarius quietus]